MILAIDPLWGIGIPRDLISGHMGEIAAVNLEGIVANRLFLPLYLFTSIFSSYKNSDPHRFCFRCG